MIYLGSLFKTSEAFHQWILLIVFEIREYILPLADEIFYNTLYVYQNLENSISSYISWFNNLQLFILIVECTSYASLTSGDRKTTHILTSSECDKNLDGWYRFEGAAGTRMPTSCPPASRCNTNVPGWLNGSHPNSGWRQSDQAGLLSLEFKLLLSHHQHPSEKLQLFLCLPL